MTHMLFRLSRVAALVLGIGMMAYMIEKRYYERMVAEAIMLFVFLGVSILYEKKRKLFSTGYIFLFIVFFITYNLFPCYFIKENLVLLQYKKVGERVPSDQFFLYFIVYISCMCIIAVLLSLKRKTILPVKREFTYESDIAVWLMGILFCLPVTIYGGVSMALLYAPIICYVFLRLKIRKYHISLFLFCMVTGSAIVILHFVIYRYIMVEYFLPIILAYLFIESYTEKSKPKKIICLLVLGIVAVGLYGVVSEIVKLNYFFNKQYDIQLILQNTAALSHYIENQIYRLFGIWSILGGNIIEYVQENGYFYGITFIKAAAPIFGFPYISLPLISASMVGASYAQPGLLAEGYANFGIIGSILNLLFPYLIAEGCLDYFLKKKSLFSICLLTVPFSKVLLDGGSINSIIIGIIMCFICFFIAGVCHNLKVRLISNIRVRRILKWN